MTYKPTQKQVEAQRLIGGAATHILLDGGSRSGKTFLIVRVLCVRALAAPRSRHAILRFRFAHAKAAIAMDTLPKVMEMCFPGVPYHIDHTDWVCRLGDGSEIWIGGLDDKERTEKILGQEFATIALNECSQIPYSSRNIAVTRLAQSVVYESNGVERALRLKMLYDCNPPSQKHWTYQVFHKGIDPDTGRPVDASQYASIQMNPGDNLENLPAGYMQTLDHLPDRMRKRFLEGRYADATPNALWTDEMIDRWRASDIVPDMQRIVVAVDPSGAGDQDNAENDAIGIVVCGLGTDGNGYVLEDLTLKAGPGTWGKTVASAFDRHDADLVVGEGNFGGAMVGFVVKAAKPGIPFKLVSASRGKVVRAEPISALTEEGKVRFVGTFSELEGELCAFTTTGYTGPRSPNRADAFVWGMTELFPGIARKHVEMVKTRPMLTHASVGSWMGV